MLFSFDIIRRGALRLTRTDSPSFSYRLSSDMPLSLKRAIAAAHSALIFFFAHSRAIRPSPSSAPAPGQQILHYKRTRCHFIAAWAHACFDFWLRSDDASIIAADLIFINTYFFGLMRWWMILIFTIAVLFLLTMCHNKQLQRMRAADKILQIFLHYV